MRTISNAKKMRFINEFSNINSSSLSSSSSSASSMSSVSSPPPVINNDNVLSPVSNDLLINGPTKIVRDERRRANHNEGDYLKIKTTTSNN
jgi:hypothetical protein